MPSPSASKPVFYGIWGEAVSRYAITIKACAVEQKSINAQGKHRGLRPCLETPLAGAAALAGQWAGVGALLCRAGAAKGMYCMRMNEATRVEKPVLAALTVLALAVSGIDPFDRLTWYLETMPVMLGLPLLIATHRRFPLTPLLYRLLFIHGLILMLGGAYTYARVPLGFWAQEAFDLARNHYDRLGHLAQGFIPSILTREILVRATPLPSGGWLFFLTTCVVLAVSASYEFVEWGAALAMGADAEAFLATQGDVWDTQWDMFMALWGALLGQVLLSRLHDRQLAQLPI
jgi:putative membrane protein